MLPFPNFEAAVDPVICQRGKQYFEEDTVYDLSKNAKGIWSATVMGSDVYEVKIIQQKDGITDWRCTCPYDGGPVCKHVVAVLYAIKEESTITESVVVESKKGKKKSPASTIDETIKNMSANELKEALTYACKQYPQLRYELQAKYAPPDKSDKTTIIDTLKQAFTKAQDRYGYISREKVPGLKRTITNFLDRAESNLQKGHYRDAADTLLALIETIVPAMEEADDSSSTLSTILEDAFRLLQELVKADLPPQLADELFAYCLKAF